MFCPADGYIIIISNISHLGKTVTKNNHRITVFGRVALKGVCLKATIFSDEMEPLDLMLISKTSP